MSEIKVNSIKGVSASTAAISIDNSSGTCTANITNNLSNRNLIINGAMQVAQRGTSSTSSGMKTIDRWSAGYAADNVMTQSQHPLTSSDTGPWEKGFRYSYHILNGDTVASGTSRNELQQPIEAQYISQSGWDYTSASSYITLTYWIRTSVANNFNHYVMTIDGTMKRWTWETGTISANTWTKITKKIPGNANIQVDTNNGEGLRVVLSAFHGTDYTANSVNNETWENWSSGARTKDNSTTWWTTNGATVEITGVQLEVGSVATDFEHRSYTQELALCQRYYFHLVSGNDKLLGLGMNYGNPDFFAEVTFPVTMRAAPSLDITTGTNYYIMHQNNTYDQMASFAISRANTNKCNLYDSGSGGSAGKGGMLATYNASASVAFSAEL